mmetsp:Transcript_55371/g.160472  ORF Transcript_55371/g.160472 Transcript_55371/m.160472 type:complete len:227 (+) Transcript_55371:769-1449(+)
MQRRHPQGLPLLPRLWDMSSAACQLRDQAGQVAQCRRRRRRAVLQCEGLQCRKQLRELLQGQQSGELLIVAQPMVQALDARIACASPAGKVGDALQQREDRAEATVRHVRLLDQNQEAASNPLRVSGEQAWRQPAQELRQSQQCRRQLGIADEANAEPQGVHDEPLDEALIRGPAAGDDVLQQALKVSARQRPDLRDALPGPQRHTCHVGQQLQAEDRARDLVPRR